MRHTRREYIPGDHLVICDRCGKKRYRSDVRKEWQGWLTCVDKCWEPRHPQEFVPPYRLDRQWVEDNRPPPITEATVASASWVAQDFTTFQEADDDARLTVAASQVDVDLYENSRAKLVKDFGQFYFKDFKIRFTAQGLSLDAGTDSAAMLAIIGSRNGYGEDYWNSYLNGVGIWCQIGSSAFKVRAVEFTGGTRRWIGSEISLSYSTDTYLLLQREQGTLYLKRYSDAAFSTLVETQSASLFTNDLYQYLIAPTLIYTGGADNDATFQVKSLAVEVETV